MLFPDPLGPPLPVEADPKEIHNKTISGGAGYPGSGLEGDRKATVDSL